MDWISVKEKLPEAKINKLTSDFEYVICVCHWDYGETDVRAMQYGKNHFIQNGVYFDEYVSHWMPLPEPPKTNNWRNDHITEKQKQLIESIKENAGINGAIITKFKGKTKGEASDWISENIGKQCYSAYCEHEDAGDRD